MNSLRNRVKNWMFQIYWMIDQSLSNTNTTTHSHSLYASYCQDLFFNLLMDKVLFTMWWLQDILDILSVLMPHFASIPFVTCSAVDPITRISYPLRIYLYLWSPWVKDGTIGTMSILKIGDALKMNGGCSTLRLHLFNSLNFSAKQIPN